MLSRIRYSPDDIRQAILEINDDKLTIDDLKIIAKNLPTPEEVLISSLQCIQYLISIISGSTYQRFRGYR